MSAAKPLVKGFFDERTFSIQYVVADIRKKKCAIVDPVLDFDEKSGATATKNADAILAYIEEQGLTVEWKGLGCSTFNWACCLRRTAVSR